jgi:hypothetical protein
MLQRRGAKELVGTGINGNGSEWILGGFVDHIYLKKEKLFSDVHVCRK